MSNWWLLLAAVILAIWLAAGVGVIVGTAMAAIVERRS
jgi:hypothetical protein